MGLTADFRTWDIRENLRATNLKGKNLEFVDDMTKDEILALFRAAEQLEPFMKTGCNLMEGKTLYTLFYQPSTRTRCSHEAAMLKMGGRVISESSPKTNSSSAKGESLYDGLRTISNYADCLVLRHPDFDEVNEALVYGKSTGGVAPIISGGWGHVTHPTQGLCVDAYTCYRAFGSNFEDMTIVVSTPDLSRARSGQSFALTLAALGARIVYHGLSELATPPVVKDKLDTLGANYVEYNNLSLEEYEQMLVDENVDMIYLPGSSVKDDDPLKALFMDNIDKFYVSTDMLDRVKAKTGKTVGLSHSLPRNAGEFDYEFDTTANEMYFKSLDFSVACRAALIAAIIGVE